jgi:hypothetical protein
MGCQQARGHRKRYVQAQQWGQGLGVLKRCHFARPLSSARLHLLSAQQDRPPRAAQPLALRQPPAGQALRCPMGCDWRCSYRHPASWSANPIKGLLHRSRRFRVHGKLQHRARARLLWLDRLTLSNRILLGQGAIAIPR